ncbi:oxidoreductase [Barrientosiimonas endolithica]|uniref:Oxidoreductase n=2 Tax=Barrientosiimonas endolithica TaxID=1535208 RepID=A0ABN6YRB6_9MICO|nr:oxidoreductase [Barrientosiimonas endolithica]
MSSGTSSVPGMAETGLIVPPDQPPERYREAVLAAERAGLPEVWFWEDCFAESGLAPAAAALAWTERIRVGVGLLPVPLRNVALTAMELATLARLFPGRLLPGIGHGVLEWMGQAGVRAESPMTLLREHATALRALLAGESVTVEGRYVRLDGVQLRWPPEQVPPVLVGAVGPKTIALAGELGDGLILTGGTSAAAVREAVARLREARPAGVAEPDVVVFTDLPVDASVQQLTDRVSELADAGATRVPVLALGDRGPESGPAILDFAARLGAISIRLA